VLALLASERVDPDGMSRRVVLVITAAVIVVVGMLFIFISRSVRRQARWAYAIAILGYGVPALASLLYRVPDEIRAQIPDWSLTANAVVQWVYLVLAFMAALLLGASFMRPDSAQGRGGTTDAAS
jgi:hypothetical protein